MSETNTGGSIKEATTAVLAVAISAAALYFLWDTYATGSLSFSDANGKIDQAKSDIFSRQKDILAMALGLFGVVLGYYFGRVPAERQADAARKGQVQAERNEADLKRTVRPLLDNIERSSDPLGGSAPAHQLQHLRELAAEVRGKIG